MPLRLKTIASSCLNAWLNYCGKHAGFVSYRGHTFSRDLIDAESVVVDLGAHRGEFSSLVIADFHCHCYAVEAIPELYEQIGPQERLETFNCAICASNQPVRFYTSNDPEANSKFKSIADSGGTTGTVVVPGSTLKRFLEGNGISKVDLLKCDIEGAEIELFDSLCDEDIQGFKQITVEFHDFIPGVELGEVRRIQYRLRSLGFLCFESMAPYPYTNADVLFVNNKSLIPVARRPWIYGLRLTRAILNKRRMSV